MPTDRCEEHLASAFGRPGDGMTLRYESGEEILPGDRVTYDGNAGLVELVVVGLTGDSASDWLFETHGAGILVTEPTVFGRVYLHAPHEEEDLRFVGRAE